MKKLKILLLLPFLLFTMACEKETDLSEAEVVAALKEALEIGSDNATADANKQEGYFKHSVIKIPFPEEAQFVYDAVKILPGGQALLDELVLKINRAAEDAADEAKPIFINAITGITIEDGFEILHGDTNAATQYLNNKTYDSLYIAFKPDIQTSLESVGAQQIWEDIITLYNSVASEPVNTDLADYTTNEGLDGLFYLVGEEEEKIREDASARVTELLQKVFSELDEE